MHGDLIPQLPWAALPRLFHPRVNRYRDQPFWNSILMPANMDPYKNDFGFRKDTEVQVLLGLIWGYQGESSKFVKRTAFWRQRIWLEKNTAHGKIQHAANFSARLMDELSKCFAANETMLFIVRSPFRAKHHVVVQYMTGGRKCPLPPSPLTPSPSPNPLPAWTPMPNPPPLWPDPPPLTDSMTGGRQRGQGRIDEQGRIGDITDTTRDFALQLPWALLFVCECDHGVTFWWVPVPFVAHLHAIEAWMKQRGGVEVWVGSRAVGRMVTLRWTCCGTTQVHRFCSDCQVLHSITETLFVRFFFSKTYVLITRKSRCVSSSWNFLPCMMCRKDSHWFKQTILKSLQSKCWMRRDRSWGEIFSLSFNIFCFVKFVKVCENLDVQAMFWLKSSWQVVESQNGIEGRAVRAPPPTGFGPGEATAWGEKVSMLLEPPHEAPKHWSTSRQGTTTFCSNTTQEIHTSGSANQKNSCYRNKTLHHHSETIKKQKKSKEQKMQFVTIQVSQTAHFYRAKKTTNDSFPIVLKHNAFLERETEMLAEGQTLQWNNLVSGSCVVSGFLITWKDA